MSTIQIRDRVGDEPGPARRLTVSSAGSAANGQFTDQELFAPFESARLEPNRISPLYRIGLRSRHGDDGSAAASSTSA